MSNDLVARLRNYANECGGGQLEDDLNAAIAALTAQPTKHTALMKFYSVDSLDGLVESQSRHVEKLQTKLREISPLSEAISRRVREG